MTNRERAFLALGIEYAEGLELADVVVIPATGREARKIPDVGWQVQPWGDNYWLIFEDLLDAVRAATPPRR